MKYAALLAFTLASIAAGSSVAQTEKHLENQQLKFETPTQSMIGRSPMRLFKQYNWIDIAYVRSMGVKVEPALPGLDDRAVYVGSGLALKIDDDQILHIFDQPEVMSEAGPIVHKLQAWLPGPRFYVVTVFCTECHMTYLIDARTGAVSDIGAPAILSSDNQLGLVYRPDMLSGDVGPFLIDFRSDPPVRIDVPPSPNCENRNSQPMLMSTPVWLDNSHVRFSGARQPGDEGAKQLLRIDSGVPKWEC